MTLLEKINSVFIRFPHRNAFCIEDIYYTYEELAVKVASIKQLLGKYPDEVRIGIQVRNDIESYASLIAIMFLGKTYIPINPNHPIDRIESIIQQSGLNIVLAKPGNQAYPGVMFLDYTTIYEGISTTFEIPEFDQNNNAYILFTSGSTGLPKGVQISFHNLISLYNASVALGYKMDETDRFLQMADLTFDLSVFSYIVPLCIGACICTVSDVGIKFTNVYKVLETQNVTFAVMVPSVLNHLRQFLPEITLPHIRHSLFCGEALYKDITTEWLRCLPNGSVENVYGPTEATVFCLANDSITSTSNVVTNNEILAIGKPMQNMDAILVDENLNEVPDGEKGEICLSGDQLTRGYLDEERNKVAFFNYNNKRFYRTGDVAYKNENGVFLYAGRIDHQVKIQGYRIELNEIEFHLRRIIGGAGVVALVTKGANDLNQIEVVFEDKNTNIEHIFEELKTKIPHYMMPVAAHIISPLPLNANGKTDRKALEKILSVSI